MAVSLLCLLVPRDDANRRRVESSRGREEAEQETRTHARLMPASFDMRDEDDISFLCSLPEQRWRWKGERFVVQGKNVKLDGRLAEQEETNPESAAAGAVVDFAELAAPSTTRDTRTSS